MKVHLLALLTLLTLALQAAPAAAQRVASPYRFVDEGQAMSLFVGQMSTDIGALRLGPQSGPFAGARYGLRLSGPLTFEVEAAYAPTTREVWTVDTTVVDTARQRQQVGEADLTIAVAQGSLRFNFTGPRTWHGILPYALVAGGAVFKVSDDDSLDEGLAPNAVYDFGTSFAGTGGVGVELFLVRRFTLRAEARTTFWKLKAPPAFVRGSAESDEWVRNYPLSAGFAYTF